MAITDKTRKLLWGRSGNRCAICRIELVHDKENNINLNVGEECHVVSSRALGPRHRQLEHYDTYENLLLLCRNHHTEIDQNVIKYPEKELERIKALHEQWIKETIDKNLGRENDGPPEFLVRLTSGKQVVDIINSVYGYRFDHDELRTNDEAEKVGNFLDVLKEWGDCADLMDSTDFAKLGIDLQADINELEQMGFFVFGFKTKEKTAYGMWDIATIRVTRHDNPTIIKIDLNEGPNDSTK